MGYGPSFQALQNIKFNAYGEATAEVRTFDWSSQEEGHYTQDHVIHPVTLDAAAQLVFLALTEGAKNTIPTTIPTRVHNLWVASSGLSHPSVTAIKVFTKSAFKGNRTTESSLFGLDTITGDLKLKITSLETTTVASQTSDSAVQVDQPQLCNEMVSKPDIELLGSNDIVAYCKSGAEMLAEPIQIYRDLGFLIFAFIFRTLDEPSAQQPKNLPEHLRKYIIWMRQQMKKYNNGELAYSEPQWQILAKNLKHVADVTERVAASGAEGRLFVAVGLQLRAIIQGEVDPLALLFNGDLAQDYYREIFNPSARQHLTAYVDLLAYKNPSMKILEVGAGTGSITKHMLSALRGAGSEGGVGRYARYDFTDISGAYFERVEAHMGPLDHKFRFKVFNIESDPAEQGLEPHSYDLVVAGLVSISSTLVGFKRSEATGSPRYAKPGYHDEEHSQGP